MHWMVKDGCIAIPLQNIANKDKKKSSCTRHTEHPNYRLTATQWLEEHKEGYGKTEKRKNRPKSHAGLRNG